MLGYKTNTTTSIFNLCELGKDLCFISVISWTPNALSNVPMTCYSTSCIVLLHDSYILESCMKCRIFSMLAHIESQSVN